MDKLAFRTLSSSEDLNSYISKVENYSGVRLPDDYVRNAKVVGVFLREKLVAGYMLVTKPDFRSLLFIPDHIKNSKEFFQTDKFEMMEVNGLWIGPGIRNPKFRIRIWLKLILDIFFCKKKYLLLMSNSKNRIIRSFHNELNPIELYEGEPFLMAGDKTHESVRVSYTTRWSLILNLPKLPLTMKSRERKLNPAFKRRLMARA